MIPGCVGVRSNAGLENGSLALLQFDAARRDLICVWHGPGSNESAFENNVPWLHSSRIARMGGSMSVVGWGGYLRLRLPWNTENPAQPGGVALSQRPGSTPRSEARDAEFVGTVSADVRTAADDEYVATLPSVPYPFFHRAGVVPTLSIGDRVRFFPRRGLVVTVPYNNRQVVIHRVDMAAAVRETGDYLFVDSMAPGIARRGEAYAYRLRVHSRRGGVLMNLAAAPDGATLSNDGTFRWSVPPAGPSERHTVEIQLTDGSGSARAHRFDVLVLGGSGD
jgi:hypothetical protein